MKTIKLGDILKLEYGKPLPQDERSRAGKYPVYGANGVKSYSDKYFYTKPSIIVGRKGSAGELTFTKGNFWPLDVTYYVVHNENETDLLYLYHLLTTLNLQSFARGVKPGINRNDIYAITVYLPDIREQRRVVEELDAAFEKIDRAIKLNEINYSNANKIFKSVLEQRFEDNGIDPFMSIGDICNVKGGKRLPKGMKLSSKKTLYPYIRVTDFDQKGGIDLNSIKYLEPEAQKLISIYIITPNDVFLSIAGTIGITGIIPKELEGANLTENACRLVPSEKIFNKYLYYFTLSNSFMTQSQDATRTTAQPKLALVRIKDIKLRVPDMKIQESIAAELEKLAQSIEILKESQKIKLDHLHKLKQSMLQQGFSGDGVQ